jgi:uncharacterized protein YjbI with pentapeptide repeats
MNIKKSDKLQKPLFTHEQIALKAYQVSQEHPECSPNENWDAAIKLLEKERRWYSKFWRWTGLGEKKGWDIVTSLSIPLVVFGGGILFNYYNGKQQEKAAIEKANQDTLVKYLDQMADSFKNGLLQAKPDSDKFIIAQTRTVIALQSVDKKRQHLIIQFLQASKLNQVSDTIKLDKDSKVQWKEGDRVLLYQAQMSKANLTNSDLSGGVLIKAELGNANLSYADLSYAVLSIANLRIANLSYANLSYANLSIADLGYADLSNANLSIADLSNANLSNANLSNAYLTGASLDEVQNLTNKQIKTTCKWDEAIYTEAEWDNAQYKWMPKDSVKNQKKIDEIKNDKASDPKIPPICF